MFLLLELVSVKKLFFGSLQSGNRDHADDVFHQCPARKVVDRRVQPLQNRTVGFRPAQPLQQLVTDVAGFNVRKDQDVGLSGNFAARRLFGSYDRIPRRIAV